jgi:RNA polymerase sigma-70 factor, ECF subfamily
MSSQPLPSVAGAATDQELVEHAQRGDARAMELVMRRHNRMMYRTARAILRDDAEAEDAVQEAYLQAFRGLAGFRGEASLSTWLVRIAANQALMRRRRIARQAQVIPIDAESAEHLMEEVAEDEAAGPENEAWKGEVRAILEKRIDALPDDFRAVFVLRAVEELTVEETANALGIPEATVRTRFFRGRALLRSALEREMDEGLAKAFGFDGERCDRIVARVLASMAPQGN